MEASPQVEVKPSAAVQMHPASLARLDSSKRKSRMQLSKIERGSFRQRRIEDEEKARLARDEADAESVSFQDIFRFSNARDALILSIGMWTARWNAQPRIGLLAQRLNLVQLYPFCVAGHQVA